VADPGYTFIEGDFKQAELFVLAELSNGTNYLAMLNTPGKDLHDATTIAAFRLKVYYADGSPWNIDEMVELAKVDPKLHKQIEAGLVYEKPDGTRLSRSSMKATLRVAGKAVGFGFFRSHTNVD
jgi:hypothetical protein